MVMPWVSRELYDAKCEELRKSEEERKRLLNLVLGQPAEVPVVSPEALAEVLTRKAVEDPEGLVPNADNFNSPGGASKAIQRMFNEKMGFGRTI